MKNGIPPVGMNLTAWANDLRRWLARSWDALSFKDASAQASQDGVILWDAAGYPVVSRSGAWRQVLLDDYPIPVDWGDIGGVLADQLDLQSALSGKAATVHSHVAADVTDFTAAVDARVVAGITGKQDTLISGTNIKTINGASILGAGDLVVSAAAAAYDYGLTVALRNNLF